MNGLFKFEIYKLIKSKAFYICSIIAVALNALSLVAVKVLFDYISEMMPDLSGATFVLFTLGSSFTVIISAFAAIFICGDYEQETIKNIYSRGFTRTQVFVTKYLAVIVGTVFIYVICALVNLTLGGIFFTFGGELPSAFAEKVITQALLVIAYTSFAFMISMVFKKNGAAISLSIAGPIVISLVLSILDVIVKPENIGGQSLSAYWLDGITTSVSVSLAGVETGINLSFDFVLSVLLCVGYTAVFLLIGWLVNSKSDK